MKEPELNNPNDPLNPGMGGGDMKRLVIFLMITVGIYMLFDAYVMQPRVEAIKAAQQVEAQAILDKHTEALASSGAAKKPRGDVLAADESKRIPFDNGYVTGTFSTQGARIDDLSLARYFETLKKEKMINMLSPSGSLEPEYAEFGWVAANSKIKLPNKDTIWSTEADKLEEGTPLVLSWDNGEGLVFEREISLDEHYLFTVKQRVFNKSEEAITLNPYALISQHGRPAGIQGNYIQHEGPLGYVSGDLIELSYDDLEDEPETKATSLAGGWIGVTAKYWLTSLIPHQEDGYNYRFVYTKPTNPLIPNSGRYQVDMTGGKKVIEPDSSVEVTMHMFSGAKQVNMLEEYEEKLGVTHFDLAVDFGWLYFLTRPFYEILTFINNYVGNFGIAIIIFTVILRACVFPLANLSFRSFANLRKVSPKIIELRDKYSDDKVRLQQELMKLYQEEGVNPMAGCLPILAQIPIFFAMYKVLYVSIEMRHAPFYGWIQDLSQPDPTSFINLFGFLPFDAPSFLIIGAWPCMMLAAMLLQRRLNPPAQDPVQAKMMAIFPFFITFILSGFASGLVIYWTVSNTLSVLQQYVIMRMMGVEVSFFKRPKNEEKLEEMVETGPDVHPGAAMIVDELEDAVVGDIHDDQPKEITAPKPKKKKKSGKKK